MAGTNRNNVKIMGRWWVEILSIIGAVYEQKKSAKISYKCGKNHEDLSESFAWANNFSTMAQLN